MSSVPISFREIAIAAACCMGLATCVENAAMKSQDIQAALREQLNPGDRPERIEAAFDRLGAIYSLDRFRNRYQGKLTDPRRPHHAIVIHVNLDEEGNFHDFEVRDSHTMP